MRGEGAIYLYIYIYRPMGNGALMELLNLLP